MIKVKESVCVCPLFPYYQVILSADTLTSSFDILRFKRYSQLLDIVSSIKLVVTVIFFSV